MFIHEAVKEAMKNDKCIAREEVWKFEGKNSFPIRIKPSNTYGNCFLYSEYEDGSPRRCQNWNPSADDLTASDWILVDSGNGIKATEPLPHVEKNDIRGLTIEIPTND